MIFPLSLEFKREICHSDIDPDIVLTHVRKRYEGLQVDEIEKLDDHRMKFKNHLFNKQGRMHIFATVDSGCCEYRKDLKILFFEFSTLRVAKIAFFIAVFFFLISRNPFAGLTVFGWLYGMNILVSLFRLSSLVDELRDEIDPSFGQRVQYHRDSKDSDPLEGNF